MAAQCPRIEAQCASHDLTLEAVCTDEGLSGRKASNRADLEDALRDVCEVRRSLIVYSLSRLARSTTDAIRIAERLQKSGAQLVMLAEQVDTNTAAGRMFYSP